MNRKSANNFKKYHRPKIIKWLLVMVLMIIFGLLLNQQLKTSKFLGNDWRTNIVFNTEPVIFISFAKQTGDKTAVFEIPGNMLLDVPNGYSQYKLNSVWKLSGLEKKPDLFSETLEDFFATYISGWVGRDDLPNINFQADNIFKQLSANFSLINLLITPNISNLSFFDRLLLSWKLNQIQNKFDLVDLTHDSTLVKPQVLPDVSLVASIEYASWFKLLTEKLVDSQIRKEDISIEIRNSTQTNGISQKFAQILTNSGAKVISLSNISKNIPKCEIIYNQKISNEKIIRWLNQEFKCTTNFNFENGGPDLIIILGKYYGDRWINSK